MKRRRNPVALRWLSAVEESRWIECPGGISSQEKSTPPRTRVQEVPSGEAGVRVFVVDSEERREYEQGMRVRSMELLRSKLEKVRKQVESGKLSGEAQIGAAAQRAMQAHHGGRYYRWVLEEGRFRFEEEPQRLDDEKRPEGRYLISSTEQELGPLEAVRMYKELSVAIGSCLSRRRTWYASSSKRATNGC